MMPAKRAKPGHGRSPKDPKYQGDYHVRSRKITAAAHADPTARCWRCGLTLEQVRRRLARPYATWHAGHIETNGRRLAAECSPCNIAERNARMRGKPRATTPSTPRTVKTSRTQYARNTQRTNIAW